MVQVLRARRIQIKRMKFKLTIWEPRLHTKGPVKYVPMAKRYTVYSKARIFLRLELHQSSLLEANLL